MNIDHEAVVIDTRHSPYSRLKPISIKCIQMEDGFWKSRIDVNQNITIPSQYQLLEATGRLDNFRRVSGKIDKPYQGYVFNDSDVYKWLEAASWTLTNHPSEELYGLVDNLLDLISSAQDENGYLNTYFSLDKAAERWTNLQDKHELYCAGHFIQAAVAHKRATGKDKAINIAVKLADHLFDTFGPGRNNGTGGHPEVEMALIELFRVTEDERYLDLAELLIDRRGHGVLGGREYLLDHRPFRNLDYLSGHAVRALYLCSGAADLYLETGEQELLHTLYGLWSNLIHKQIYITGSLGSRHDGESLGEPYELPNSRAYAETCAAIASMMWNWRMFHIDGNSQFIDTLEWTLFNAILPGISLDGTSYFYVNPLKANSDHERQSWYSCACCPPNVARTIAMLPGYLYSYSNEGIWVNLFASSRLTFELENGGQFCLHERTNYPWDGRVIFTFESIRSTQSDTFILPVANQEFSLFIRIPAWVPENSADIKVNNTFIDQKLECGRYARITRVWQVGDSVEINLPMAAQYMEAHPKVDEDCRRIAITRGPIVYCFEDIDNPGIEFNDMLIDTSKAIQEQFISGLLDGITQIDMVAKIYTIDPGWDNHLYRRFNGTASNNEQKIVRVKAIPYFTWANRSRSQMQIWSLYI